MRPIFTIHAGEYLVGSYIEQSFRNWNVWIPSKDTGVDLLITNKTNTKTASLQVKFSKNFLITHYDEHIQAGLLASGFWTINKEKLSKSIADYWVFVLYSINQKKAQHIVIKPKELLNGYYELNRKNEKIHTYFGVTKTGKCWETRGTSKDELRMIAKGEYSYATRDFTKYLNNWDQIKL